MMLMLWSLGYMLIMTITVSARLIVFIVKVAYFILKAIVYSIAYVAYVLSKIQTMERQRVPIKINKGVTRLGTTSH